MFQALLCPSSGARDYDVIYHIGCVVRGLLCVGGEVQLGFSSVRVGGSSLQPGHYSSLTALCPSSGARDYDVVYHIGRVVRGLLCVGGELQLGWSSVRVGGSSLQPGHYSSLTATHIQHTANHERHDQCGKQHHSRELLMMGIVMLETC